VGFDCLPILRGSLANQTEKPDAECGYYGFTQDFSETHIRILRPKRASA
jgi:hypothetical protein